MLFVWDMDKINSFPLVKTYLVCAKEDGGFFDINERIVKSNTSYIMPISYIYEIRRNKEPFVSYDGGRIYFDDYHPYYQYISIKLFSRVGEYKRGDVVLAFCLLKEKPRWWGWFDWTRDIYNSLKQVTEPTEKVMSELKFNLLRLLEAEESQKQVEVQNEAKEKWNAERKKEEQKQQAILREQQQKEDDQRETCLEKARLERENEALKIRLEMENKAKEEANRILAENLRIQQAALEEEARLTREILEMRERIERQDLDATNKTVESIRDLFGHSKEKSK